MLRPLFEDIFGKDYEVMKPIIYRYFKKCSTDELYHIAEIAGVGDTQKRMIMRGKSVEQQDLIYSKYSFKGRASDDFTEVYGYELDSKKHEEFIALYEQEILKEAIKFDVRKELSKCTKQDIIGTSLIGSAAIPSLMAIFLTNLNVYHIYYCLAITVALIVTGLILDRLGLNNHRALKAIHRKNEVNTLHLPVEKQVEIFKARVLNVAPELKNTLPNLWNDDASTPPIPVIGPAIEPELDLNAPLKAPIAKTVEVKANQYDELFD